MATTMVRDIIHIDEEKCDGCGLCVPKCAEGAIQIIDGKARLVGENLCDGLGNCLGVCPQGAIRIERRAAEGFDEEAVAAHLASQAAASHDHGTDGHMAHEHAAHMAHEHAAQEGHAHTQARTSAGPPASPCGCPGAAPRKLQQARSAAGRAATRSSPMPGTGGANPVSSGASAAVHVQSELGHWPVQIHLLPVQSDLWKDADVLIAADCVGFAMPDFHARMLSGKTLAVGCPKLDDLGAYVKKLTAILTQNQVRSVTVAHMEVPCCTGIVTAVREAMTAANVENISFRDVIVGIDGRIQQETHIPER